MAFGDHGIIVFVQDKVSYFYSDWKCIKIMLCFTFIIASLLCLQTVFSTISKRKGVMIYENYFCGWALSYFCGVALMAIVKLDVLSNHTLANILTYQSIFFSFSAFALMTLMTIYVFTFFNMIYRKDYVQLETALVVLDKSKFGRRLLLVWLLAFTFTMATLATDFLVKNSPFAPNIISYSGWFAENVANVNLKSTSRAYGEVIYLLSPALLVCCINIIITLFTVKPAMEHIKQLKEMTESEKASDVPIDYMKSLFVNHMVLLFFVTVPWIVLLTFRLIY